MNTERRGMALARRIALPAGFCLLFLSAVATRTQDMSGVEVKSHAVRGTVHYLEGRGGNIGVCAGEDGVIMVDDQFAPLAPKIEKAVASISKKPIAFLLNTHWHGDHVGGNAHFGQKASIIAHTNVRKRMAGADDIEGKKATDTPPEALPVLTFDETISLHFNGEEILVMHFPRSHTDGDSVVYFTGSNVIHMGDLYFAGRFPFVDYDSGGTVQGLIDSVGAILASLPADTLVIPGHGEPTGVDGLREYLGMLTETRSLVARALQDGKTPEEVGTSGLLEDFGKTWGGGFINTERFTGFLIRDVQAEK